MKGDSALVIEREAPAQVVDLVVMMATDRHQLVEIGAFVPCERRRVMDVTVREPDRAPRPRTRPVHRPQRPALLPRRKPPTRSVIEDLAVPAEHERVDHRFAQQLADRRDRQRHSTPRLADRARMLETCA
jgi:hypothetical protein